MVAVETLCKSPKFIVDSKFKYRLFSLTDENQVSTKQDDKKDRMVGDGSDDDFHQNM